MGNSSEPPSCELVVKGRPIEQLLDVKCCIHNDNWFWNVLSLNIGKTREDEQNRGLPQPHHTE